MSDIGRKVAILTEVLCPNDYDRDGYCGCPYCRKHGCCMWYPARWSPHRPGGIAGGVLDGTYDPGGPSASQKS